MSQELILLLSAAATISVTHTILGPDHYLPFVVLAKARGWSYMKTMIITTVCGAGHVLGSVVLGITGIMLGLAVSKLEYFDFYRGELAAWALITFGLVYSIWGVRKALTGSPHHHTPHGVHSPPQLPPKKKEQEGMTPWLLFMLFLFGPCEPLIPILMYPSAKHSFTSMVLVTAVFAVVTVLTMLSIVSGLYLGVKELPLGGVTRYSHALAGLTILLCGGAIKVLGV